MRILLVLFGSLVPAAAHAKVIDSALNKGAGVAQMWASICSTLPFCDVGNEAPAFFATKVTNFIFGIIIAAAILTIMFAGLRLISSAGSDDRMAEAKKTVGFALGGLVLAILGRSIILFIANSLLPRLLGS